MIEVNTDRRPVSYSAAVLRLSCTRQKPSVKTLVCSFNVEIQLDVQSKLNIHHLFDPDSCQLSYSLTNTVENN